MLESGAASEHRAQLARLAALGDSPRYLRLAGLEAMYKGLQYEGRASFWDPTVPLRERAPCASAHLVESAIARLVALTFGAAKFPTLNPKPRSYGLAFTDAERGALDALLDEVIAALRLKTNMPRLLTQGLACASACAIVGLRDGALTLQLVPAKDATPELAPDGSVRSLEIRYKYARPELPKGGPALWWYRRVIDATSDTVYAPAPVTADGREPAWVVAETAALEFCPVAWHRNAPDPGDADGLDGVGLFEGLEAEVEALDFVVSQRYRNGLYNGEPQTVLVGVDPEKPVGASGRVAEPGTGGWLDRAYSAVKGWQGGGGALKKAPGTIWRIPQGGSAMMLESTGAGAGILAGNAEALAKHLLDATGVVMADPGSLGAADMSARALAILFAPMIDRADALREEYGAFLTRLIDLALRLLTTRAAQAGGVFLDALAPASPVLARCYRPLAGGGVRWLGPALDVTWGDYFTPSWLEVQQAVMTAQAGNGGKPVMTQRRSVQLIAAVVGIDDVDGEVAALEASGATDASAMHSMMGALGAAPAGSPAPLHPRMIDQQNKLKATAGEAPAEEPAP